jgi:hypothetical protein
MLNFEHCLRPVFTENIFAQLQNGRSINLIGQPGTGRKRLLEDLKRLKLLKTTVVLVNMKTCRESYQRLLTEIWEQTGKNSAVPNNLTDLLRKFQTGNRRVWLLLDNFDALLNEVQLDEFYNEKFFETLNSIKNKPHCVLLCVTHKPHDQSVVITPNGVHRNSWLDLEKEYLPSLNYLELKAEVARHRLPWTETGIQEFTEAIYLFEEPCRLLEFMLKKVKNREDTSLNETLRLEKWRKQFAQVEQPNQMRTTRGWFALANRILLFCKLLRLDKLKNHIPFSKAAKALADLIGNSAKKTGEK